MLKDDDFSKKASVDKYGRRLVQKSGRKDLERFYRIGEGEGKADEKEVDDDEDVARELRRVERKYDPAREGGFEESSSEEESDEEEDSEEDDEVEVEVLEGAEGDDLEVPEKGDVPMGEVSSRIAVVNLDWDNIRAVDLMAVAASFCPPEGKIEDVTVYPSEFGREAMEREDMEGPPKELFGALVNNDHSDDEDSGFESEGSEDGKEDDDEAVKSKLIKDSTADTSEVDTHALREYQMSRLRYYYAVIRCSNNNTAHALYNDMDGREYLSTANFFDMRFVPDGVTFDDPINDKPRDSCTKVPPGYRPNEFVTEALTHSKVRLTWDEDDKGRKEVQKRAFSRQEIDENDLQAYIGSDSSDDEVEDGAAVGLINSADVIEEEAPQSKAESARQKMRAALGLSAEPTRAKSSKKTKAGAEEPTGGMQVTFSAGLTSAPARTSVFENRPEDVKEESTMEKYVRKERERKARRKARMKAERQGLVVGEDGVEVEDESDQEFIGDATTTAAVVSTQDAAEDQDDPFNDPFFDNPAAANAAAKKLSKKEKRKQADATAAVEAERKAKERAALELLMTDGDGVTGLKGAHFDMAEIKKAEKAQTKKKQKQHEKKMKKMKKGETDAKIDVAPSQQQDFEMDVTDPRFASVFESHEFAIDPSNPKFSGTKGMKKLLEEGRRKRRAKDDEAEVVTASWLGERGKKSKGGDKEVDELLQRVKRRRV